MRTFQQSSLFRIWLLLFISLAWGHYGLTPITDFVADDWGYLGSSAHETPMEIVRGTVQDYYRPVNILVNRLLFLWPGDSPITFSVARVLLHGAILSLFLILLHRIFHSDEALWIGGAIYAFAPILHEMFHWANMVAILYYPLAMLGSLLLWARWVDGKSGCWAFILSLGCYTVAILTYENCIPLCLVFPLFSLLFAKSYRIRWSCTYTGLALLYTVYRFTHGFGLGHAAIHGGAYFGEGEGISIVFLVQNVRTIFSWWFGGLGAHSFLGGFNAFATLAPKIQFGFVIFSILFLIVLAHAWSPPHLDNKPKNESLDSGSMHWKGVIFGGTWGLLSYAPHLLFPVASRHHMIPIFGVGILCAALMSFRKPKISPLIWMGIGLVCMIANIGNAIAWKDAGVFCRRLQQYVQATQNQWQDKELVLFDTHALRERQTPGILGPRMDAPATWAEYQNAILLRGFVGSGMLRMCSPTAPKAIQDTECGSKVKDGTLYWHERYNPSKPHETPLDKVFSIDCLAVVTKAGTPLTQ